MYNLSIFLWMYFDFDLNVMFYQGLSEKKGIYFMFVCVVVGLGVRGELQVLKVLIIVIVFPQMYMGFLEMKYVLMIEGDLSNWMLVLLEIPGMS